MHHIVTESQSSALDQLLNAARAVVSQEENNERDRSGSALMSDELHAKTDHSCLDFCISLFDHCLKGNIYDSVIIRFTTVLGIDLAKNCFREPADYTSQLSALAKMGQMLVMQRVVVGADIGEVDFPANLLNEIQD